MEDKRMTSREFTDLVGISLKTLERMEKAGKIVPYREGRTRYYFHEQVKQFEEAEGKFVLGIGIQKNVVVTLAYAEEPDNEILKLLSFCLDNSVAIDDTYEVKCKDIKQDIIQLVDVCRDPRIAKIIYSGKESVLPILKEECQSHGVMLVKAEQKEEEKKKSWFRRWLDGRRKKKNR